MRGPASTTLVLLFVVVGTLALGPISKTEVSASKKAHVEKHVAHVPAISTPPGLRPVARDPVVLHSVRKPLVEAFRKAFESSSNDHHHHVHRSVSTVDADHVTLEHPVVLAFQRALSTTPKKIRKLKPHRSNAIMMEKLASKLSPKVKQFTEKAPIKKSKRSASPKVAVDKPVAHALTSVNKTLVKPLKVDSTSKPATSSSHLHKRVGVSNPVIHAFEKAMSGASRKAPKAELKPKQSTGVKQATEKDSVKTKVHLTFVEKPLLEALKLAMKSKSAVPAPKAVQKGAEKKLALKESVQKPVIHAFEKALTASSRKASKAELKPSNLKQSTGVKQATVGDSVKTPVHLSFVKKPLMEALKIAMKSGSVAQAPIAHEKVAEKKLKELGFNPAIHAFKKALKASSRKALKAELKPKQSTGVKQATAKASVKTPVNLSLVKTPLVEAFKSAMKSKSVAHAPEAHENAADKKLKLKEAIHAFQKALTLSSRKALKMKLKPKVLKQSTGEEQATVEDSGNTPAHHTFVRKPFYTDIGLTVASKSVAPAPKAHEKVAEKKLKKPVENTVNRAIEKALAVSSKSVPAVDILNLVPKHSDKSAPKEVSAKKLKDSAKEVQPKKSHSRLPTVASLSSLPEAEAEKYEEYLKKAVADYNAPFMTAIYNKRNKDKTVMLKENDGSIIMGFDEKYAMCLIHFSVKGHEVTTDPKISHFTLCIPYLRVMVNEFLHYLATQLKA